MDQNTYLIKGQEILRRLNELGYEAYFIGGVVRDHLLKIPFSDIDITTSATPEQLLEVFPNAKKEFADLGSVTIVIDDMEYEITTFRTEEYTNVRKPSTVHYSKKLREDVIRRDFTINALAMSPNGKIYDLCEGTKDLDSKIIRAIGNPKDRFREDPLRILRAFRLISKLDFSIEPKTVAGILAMRKELSKLTEAKVIGELTKIFQGQFAPSALKQMINAGITLYLPLDRRALKIISSSIKKISVEEAFAICYKLSGSVSEKANFSQNTLKRLQQIIDLSKIIENDPVTDVILFKYGPDVTYSANRINRVMYGMHYKDQEKTIKKLETSQPIAKMGELAFKGQDLLILTNGKQGPFFGEILDSLKMKVVTKELPNDFYRLREEAIRLLDAYKLDLKPVSNTKPQEPSPTVSSSPRQELRLAIDDETPEPFDTPSGLNQDTVYARPLTGGNQLYVEDDDDPFDETSSDYQKYMAANRDLANRYRGHGPVREPVVDEPAEEPDFTIKSNADIPFIRPDEDDEPYVNKPKADNFYSKKADTDNLATPNKPFSDVSFTSKPDSDNGYFNNRPKPEDNNRFYNKPEPDKGFYAKPEPETNPKPAPDAGRFARPNNESYLGNNKPANDNTYRQPGNDNNYRQTGNYNPSPKADNNLYGRQNADPNNNRPFYEPNYNFTNNNQNPEIRHNVGYANRENDHTTNSTEAELARKEEEIRIQWQILMKERFKLDFEKMVQATIANLPNANLLTPEQKANLASQMGPSIRQMLININIDYQKLAKEGII